MPKRTAQTIAENAERRSGELPKRKPHPNSLKNLVAPWTKETRPKSPGRPKDTAAEIARKAFEHNIEKIYEAYSAKLLVGDAYAFSVLADRGFGKLKQGVIHTGDEDGGPIKSSIEVSFVKPADVH